MWVLIDNYDSFTHILHHYLLQLHSEVQVIQHDGISLQALEELKPKRFIFSPGPKTPADAGITLEVIARFYQQVPMLGVCLGHQALGQFFGAQLSRAKRPMHGRSSKIKHVGSGLFAGLPNPLQVMRYHSLVLTHWQNTELKALAETEEGELMAFAHAKYPIVGLQFHPESIETEFGFQLLQNWQQLFPDL